MAKSSNGKRPAATAPAERTAKDEDLARDEKDQGQQLTTNQGLKLSDDQNSLKAGVRGPTLLEDFHFREKITHFDHERIPERVVHARGAAAHGYFEATGDVSKFTKAGLFQAGKKTPVFVRFSTVAGSRGSADTPRDVRGFAVKFYTEQGVWDLVGNNMPVFFIQDAIKFPDLIHAVKPEPNREIPQAASAHDTFWDFISLTPEAMHMIMWVMSDRALPRTLASMEGFGIHTFRFINAQGASSLVKFHFKPAKGVHSMVWDESHLLTGRDPDFQRRNLWDSIEMGDFPEWEMGVQVVAEGDEKKFDFDLLDPTKIIPEELVPITPLGKMVLNRNPENYFAETEQVAFHPGHVVPGIDFSNDPLLQGRLFSYLDTQLKRVGPNFAQLPINRPTCPFHNNQRDGESQQLVHKGRVSYFPNSLANNCPMHSPEAADAFVSYAEKMDGTKVRMRSPSFADHFSQATLFWNSMADWEQAHIVSAISFELNNCEVLAVKQRVVDELLVNVHPVLAERVAKNIGITIKGQAKAKPHDKASAALSMNKPLANIKGRKVAILAGDGVDAKQVEAGKSAIMASGGLAEVIAKHGGAIKAAGGEMIPVDRAAPNAPSVIYDAVFIPGGASAAMLAKENPAIAFIAEAHRHGKTIAALCEGGELLKAAHIDVADSGKALAADGGVIAGWDPQAVSKALVDDMLNHRHYQRQTETKMGSGTP